MAELKNWKDGEVIELEGSDEFQEAAARALKDAGFNAVPTSPAVVAKLEQSGQMNTARAVGTNTHLPDGYRPRHYLEKMAVALWSEGQGTTLNQRDTELLREYEELRQEIQEDVHNLASGITNTQGITKDELEKWGQQLEDEYGSGDYDQPGPAGPG